MFVSFAHYGHNCIFEKHTGLSVTPQQALFNRMAMNFISIRNLQYHDPFLIDCNFDSSKYPVLTEEMLMARLKEELQRVVKDGRSDKLILLVDDIHYLYALERNEKIAYGAHNKLDEVGRFLTKHFLTVPNRCVVYSTIIPLSNTTLPRLVSLPVTEITPPLCYDLALIRHVCSQLRPFHVTIGEVLCFGGLPSHVWSLHSHRMADHRKCVPYLSHNETDCWNKELLRCVLAAFFTGDLKLPSSIPLTTHAAQYIMRAPVYVCENKGTEMKTLWPLLTMSAIFETFSERPFTCLSNCWRDLISTFCRQTGEFMIERLTPAFCKEKDGNVDKCFHLLVNAGLLLWCMMMPLNTLDSNNNMTTFLDAKYSGLFHWKMTCCYELVDKKHTLANSISLKRFITRLVTKHGIMYHFCGPAPDSLFTLLAHLNDKDEIVVYVVICQVESWSKEELSSYSVLFDQCTWIHRVYFVANTCFQSNQTGKMIHISFNMLDCWLGYSLRPLRQLF